VHEEGFTVETLPKEADKSALLFRTPTGRPILRIPPSPRLPGGAVERLKRQNQARGLRITPRTNFIYWDGSSPDYSYCVGVAQARS